MKRLIFVALIIGCVGCAPKPFEPFTPPQITLNDVPPYELNLEPIDIGDPPIPIYLDKNFHQVGPKDKTAYYVAYAPSERDKILKVVRLAKRYREIIEEQSVTISEGIDLQNMKADLFMMEQYKANTYRELWVNSENAYRQEHYERTMDNAFNRATIGVVTVAGIIGCILLGL